MPTNFPKVTVIIPTKNEEKNIERCLLSIKRQNYPQNKIEIIVVDNHSKDSTLKVVKKHKVKGVTMGFERSSQRNYGAKIATGKHLFFLDADMELSANLIREVSSLLEKNINIVSIPEIGEGETFWEKVLSLEKSCYIREKDIHAARAFSKKLFWAAGGYDEKMFAGEDWDLTIRCKKTKARLVMGKCSLIHYEKAKSFYDLLKKDNYYISNIHRFAQKNSKEFKKYASLRYRGWLFLKNYKNLLKKPIRTIALVVYKFFIHLYSRPHWYKEH